LSAHDCESSALVLVAQLLKIHSFAAGNEFGMVSRSGGRWHSAASRTNENNRHCGLPNDRFPGAPARPEQRTCRDWGALLKPATMAETGPNPSRQARDDR